MTGTIGRLKEPDTKSPLQRAINRIMRSTKFGLVALSIGTSRFEPIIEPAKRKTKILFKPGEKEALTREAEADERQGRFIAAGIKYAQVGESHRAYEMIRKCLSAGIENGEEHIMAAIEEYC